MTPDGKQVSVQMITGFYEPSNQNMNYSFTTIDLEKTFAECLLGDKKTSLPMFSVGEDQQITQFIKKKKNH